MLRTYLVYNTVVRLFQFFCCGGKVLLRPEKNSSHLSGRCAIIITTGKKVLVVIVIMTGKKSSSRLSGGCAIVITTGKKSSSRDFYAKLNVLNLNVMNLY